MSQNIIYFTYVEHDNPCELYAKLKKSSKFIPCRGQLVSSCPYSQTVKVNKVLGGWST